MNDTIILATLLRGPTHGYALKKMAGISQGTRDLHPNVVYPALREFVRRGWISQKRVPGERGQDRKQYSLTLAGRDELIRRLEQVDESTAADRGEFLMRASLCELMSPAARSRLLRLRGSHLNERLRQLQAFRADAEPANIPTFVLDFVLSGLNHELRWLALLERRVNPRSKREIVNTGNQKRRGRDK